ncbi:MAG TPA: bifunctional hydroxymethylpyrimidine kinase/phosphomethylpyrimidine kinase [Verrucomicrobiae bacterium]|nr:bifunctional hydroxymethylpyrimidine kinase/phosphomethylpyrimidine kinase [Verrucomicrobiae bacterium]
MKRALSIAGSDSSGGAGIQADIKTFSALGLYCSTVITVLTAQNTETISKIFVTPSEFFRDQLQSTLDDIIPDVIKIGVLYEKTIIDIVYNIVSSIKIPVILDPILISGTRIKLLKDDDFDEFTTKIVPLSLVITPNIYESERLSGLKISSEKDQIEAAYKIMELGAKNVIIKGGSILDDKSKVMDILLEKDNSITKILNERVKVIDTHGTGCNFSAALASFLGKEYSMKDSFILTNEYIKNGLYDVDKIGNGIGVTNPLHKIYENSTKYEILNELNIQIRVLEELKDFYNLIPETSTNFVYCLEGPKNYVDVAGILGRITTLGNKIRAPNIVEFGASIHVANALIIANQYNKLHRSAINIKNTDRLLDICKRKFNCSSYSRKDEDPENKLIEGQSIKWGIKHALDKSPNAEVVSHQGDQGKEPMIIVFGRNPNEIVKKINIILSELKD